MGTPSSGVIALSDLKNEWSDTNPVSLSEFYAGGTYVGADAVGVPTSGAVSLSQYYNLYNMWVSGLTSVSAFSAIYGTLVDSSGNSYLCGSLSSNKFSVIKINSSGVLQWQYEYSATGSFSVSRVALDSSNNIYVVGSSGNMNVSGRTDGFVVKINSSGTVQWCRSFKLNEFATPNNRTTRVQDIGFDSSNNVYVSGYYARVVTSVSTRDIAFVMKIDTNSNIQWYKGFEISTTSGGFYNTTNYTCAVDSSGTTYISNINGGGLGISFAKFDSNGNYITFVNYNGGYTDTMRVDGNGYLNAINANENAVAQMDGSFNFRWRIQSALEYTNLFLDSSSNIYVTGKNNGAFSKLNNSGTVQWQRLNRYTSAGANGGLNTYTGGIDSSGNIYTSSLLPFSNFLFTKKYPSNVYLPVSSVNVCTVSSITYQYQTLSSAFSSLAFPTNNTSGITPSVIVPAEFLQYTNSISVASTAFTPLKVNSAY